MPVTVPVSLPLSVKVSPAGRPEAERARTSPGWVSLAETGMLSGLVVGHALAAGQRQARRHILHAEDGAAELGQAGRAGGAESEGDAAGAGVVALAGDLGPLARRWGRSSTRRCHRPSCSPSPPRW